ncbi:MAG: tetratricopeptide repeat protein [Planctomycetes bacterium]|nr:tetratricopeptide repeat protein [Planctomycetota bacterium]
MTAFALAITASVAASQDQRGTPRKETVAPKKGVVPVRPAPERKVPEIVEPSKGTKGPFHDLKVAMGLLTKARVGAARQLLEKVVKDAPKFGEAWHQLALCHELGNNAEAAQQSASMALRCEPKHARAALLLARLSLREDPVLASDYARRANQNAASDVAVRRDAAHILMDTGNLDEAHEIAESLAKNDPTNQRLLTLRSELAIAMRDFDTATKHLQTLALLRPGDPLPYENLAGIAWSRGHQAEAISALEHALRRRPKPEARKRLIQWLEESGAPAERIAAERRELQKVVPETPSEEPAERPKPVGR